MRPELRYRAWRDRPGASLPLVACAVLLGMGSMPSAGAVETRMLHGARQEGATGVAPSLPLWCGAAVRESAARSALPDLLVALPLESDCADVDPGAVGTARPSTCSLQAAVDFVNRVGDPSPGDGVILIGVVEGASRERGAAALPVGADVVLENHSSATLDVQGCNVKLRSPDIERPVILLRSGAGPLRVAGIEIEGSASVALRIEGAGAPVTIEDAILAGNDDGMVIDDAGRVVLRRLRVSKNQRDGIRIAASASGRRSEVAVISSTLEDNYSSGVRAETGGDGALHLSVSASRFRGNNVALDLAASGSARLDVEVTSQNVFASQRSHAINLATPTAASGATVAGTIEGNRIDGVASGSGVRVSLNGKAAAVLVIKGNTIRRVEGGRGVDATARLGANRLDLSIADNDIELGPGAASGVLVRAGAAPEDTSTVCVATSGNTITAGASRPGFALEQSGSGVLRLAGGAAARPLVNREVVDQLRRENGGSTTSTTVGEITGAPPGSCAGGGEVASDGS